MAWNADRGGVVTAVLVNGSLEVLADALLGCGPGRRVPQLRMNLRP